ncbi:MULTISPECIES: nuclear transport factor 2 family protein [Halomonas]|uniref:nuclear transport factor 2 family protein n=1 Tax=Halomonas TaxID=2745 RepID=UPI001C97FBA4|nr:MULTISPECIES: nuclear transport factor 2 family protein [Halomonas]MBY6208888.1 nuclear transport factor 2 family protein [Halomonas sp. DP3Y7-2]MBY6227358.1 nuclear transport factor 2 family protein [Halomonas sp. DP3Y7-1]MCA0914892.1 nuclear transport factor 2 family protein [Halomonas denitrificans]
MSQPDAQFLADFADALNRHDIDAVMSMMTDDCEFHAVAGPELLGKTFHGQEQVRAGLRAAWENAPDAQWLDGVHQVIGDRGYSESTYCGTTVDGMRSEARMIDAFTFRDGKIAVKNAFRKQRPATPTRQG